MLISEITRLRSLFEDELDGPDGTVTVDNVTNVELTTVTVDEPDEEEDNDIIGMMNPLQQEFEIQKKDAGIDNNTDELNEPTDDNIDDYDQPSAGEDIRSILSKMDAPYSEDHGNSTKPAASTDSNSTKPAASTDSNDSESTNDDDDSGYNFDKEDDKD